MNTTNDIQGKQLKEEVKRENATISSLVVTLLQGKQLLTFIKGAFHSFALLNLGKNVNNKG